MYQKQQGSMPLYLLALCCLFAGIACTGFIIYILPYTLFGFKYDVPSIVAHVSVWYETHYNFVGTMQLLGLYLPILVLAFLFFLIARYLDLYLETHHEPGVPEIPETELLAHEKYTVYATLEEPTKTISFKPIFLVLGIILIAALFVLAGEYITVVNFFR